MTDDYKEAVKFLRRKGFLPLTPSEVQPAKSISFPTFIELSACDTTSGIRNGGFERIVDVLKEYGYENEGLNFAQTPQSEIYLVCIERYYTSSLQIEVAEKFYRKGIIPENQNC